MNELACCIVSSYPEAFVVRTLPSDVGAGVLPMAERTCARWGVSISHGNLAVIELAIYEFKYGDTFRRSGVELFVYSAAHYLEAGSLEFVRDQEPSV